MTMRAVFSSPSFRILSVLNFQRSLSSSTPTASAWNFWAAMMTMRPSPDPRSNIFSPAFNPPNCSIFSTTVSGVG